MLTSEILAKPLNTSKFIKLAQSGEYYSTEFDKVRSWKSVLKHTGSRSIDSETFDSDIKPFINNPITLEQLYYACALRDGKVEDNTEIDNEYFLINLIVNKAMNKSFSGFGTQSSRSIKIDISWLDEAYDEVKEALTSHTKTPKIFITSEDRLIRSRKLINRIVCFNDDFTAFTPRWIIDSLKSIKAHISDNEQNYKIFIGGPGTGKSYTGIKEIGNKRTLIISLSNVVGSNMCARAINHKDFGYEDYQFASFTKVRLALSGNIKSFNIDDFDAYIFEEASMLSSTELKIIEHIVSLHKPTIFLGDIKQLPSFLGLGNILYSLMDEFPNIVTVLEANHRVDNSLYKNDLESVGNAMRHSKTGTCKGRFNSMKTFRTLESNVVREWLDHVKAEEDCLSTASTRKDVNTINNKVLSYVFECPVLLQDNDTNDMEGSKGLVFNWLLNHGKEFIVISEKNLKNANTGEYKYFNGERFIASYGGQSKYGDDLINLHSITFKGKRDITITLKSLSMHFNLGYCLTTHKCQGSEADYVLYYESINNVTRFLVNANLRYVGITRAKKQLYASECVATIPKSFLIFNNNFKEII